MRHTFAIPLLLIVALAGLCMLILVAANPYGRYLRIPRGKAALLLLAAFVASLGFGFFRIHQFDQNGGEKDVISICFAFLLPWAGVPFLAKLYLAWIAGAASDEEKAPGMAGVRAWLRAGNLVCAILVSICLRFGFGYSFLGPLALALLALVAFPLMNAATASPPAAAPQADSLSPERERVLKMLDEGKITAPESAELLNALAHSTPPRAPQSAPAPHRKTVWIGAALLLLGFFLPWFAINPQRAVDEMMKGMPMGQGMPDLRGMMPEGNTLYIAGGDIGHGLGWCVLVLGILAAALPFVAANLDAQTCQKTCLLALAAGAIILVYLLTQNMRFVNIGIILGLAGYVLEFIGVLKERELNWARAA
jgi:hypothetical protein